MASPVPSLKNGSESAFPPAELRAEQVVVARGGSRVVKAVSLVLRPGQRTALVGPNGAGKSTLLRALAGVAPVSLGEVRLDGRPLTRWRRLEIARRIAFLAQGAGALFPLSCLETVLLGRSPHKRGLGLADHTDLELAESAMRRLEVWQLADRPVSQVSGGELQRVMMARVLVQQCPILLLDEPTSAQDPKASLRLLTLLAELAERGATLLVAIHDLNLALRGFDRVAVLCDGELLACEAPERILELGALETAFGVRLRRVGEAAGRPVVVAEGQPPE